jgi:hypothetical protein
MIVKMFLNWLQLAIFLKSSGRLFHKTAAESEYCFFPPPKSEYFFQQHWESEYFF